MSPSPRPPLVDSAPPDPAAVEDDGGDCVIYDDQECNCWESYDDGRCHHDHTPPHCCACSEMYCRCRQDSPVEVKGFDGDTVATLR